MALTGSTNEEKIWNYLYTKIGNAYGTAGLMGNLYAESGLKPKNLQNSYEKKLGYTDDTYTAAVDNGIYSRDSFKSDSAGYGLVQWTYSTRKANMYDYIVTGLGKSIGDLESQLAFLIKEIKTYTAVWSTIATATSVKEASDKVLTGYENPADQSSSAKTKRAGYGEGYYEKYASPSTTTSTSSTSTASSSSSSSSGISAGTKLTLKNTPLYASATAASAAAKKTGTYYAWDNTKTNGRIRITNTAARVGKSGQVTGWVDIDDVSTSASTSTPSYTVGKTYTLQTELNVRKGAGTSYALVGYNNMTTDGKKHDSDKDGALDKGTSVTCLATKTVSGDIWMRIPSGWIAAYYDGNIYVK